MLPLKVSIDSPDSAMLPPYKNCSTVFPAVSVIKNQTSETPWLAEKKPSVEPVPAEKK
jgi:hypothetical protein